MAASTYLNFDLFIEPWQEAYQARVLASPFGQASVIFNLPFSAEELATLLARDMPAKLEAQLIGARLFQAIFYDEVGRCLRRSIDKAQNTGEGLRLRLRLTNVPELMQLPWEYLYDTDRHRFLTLSEQTPIVRYMDLPETEAPLGIELPLRILVMLANPSDISPRLDTEAEWERLQGELNDLQMKGLVVLERLTTATMLALQQRLQQEPVHIFHFVGHGFFDQASRGCGLILENDTGEAQLATAEALNTLLRDHQALRLAFLNACSGARNATSDPFMGTAQRLIQQGLPAVIAMQFSISDRAATVLTQGFYRALVGGYPVDAALVEARKALYIRDSLLEWGTPVLFMRAPDGRLFDLPENNPAEPAPGISPFKGLHFFDTADADLFFGREQLIAELVAYLHQHRFLAVIGASGSGKSSLIRAGLAPALHHHKPLVTGALPPAGSEKWLVHIITPTANPLETLAASLTRTNESVTATATLIDDLAKDARSLHLYVHKLLAGSAHTATNGDHLLLIVDQFEELFTLCRDKQVRKAFIDNLLTAAFTPSTTGMGNDALHSGPTIVVINLRADFYAYCAEFEQLRVALERNQRFIGPMNTEDLRRAIEEPAHQANWQFEPGLVELFLDDVGDEPGALPLLSHALLETWKRRQGRMLTFAGYTASGRVQGAIARTAETVFNQRLTGEQKLIARNIFLRLTELGEGAQDTRRRTKLQELMPQSAQADSVENVLTILADARLITTFAGEAEVAHEALIREWPQLREWLADDREGLRIQRRLTEATQEWLMLARDSGVLLRGVRLEQTLAWNQEHKDELNEQEQAFLEASKEAVVRIRNEQETIRRRELEQSQALAQAQLQRAEEQAKAAANLRRRNFWLRSASIAAVLLAFTAIWFALQSSKNASQANASAAEANQQRRLAEDGEKVALLAQQAAQAAASAEAVQRRVALQQARVALAGQAANASLLAHQSQIDRANSIPLLLAREATQMTWLADGDIFTKSFITPIADTALRQALAIAPPWKMTLPTYSHTDTVWSVAFSPDGKWLASASLDNQVHLWDANTGQHVRTLVHSNQVYNAAFSPDGKLLVTSSTDKLAHLWNSETGEEIGQLAGHTNWLHWAAFSPDGKTIVTASWDQTARLWDVATKKEIHTLIGHTDVVNVAAFSPDGRWVATASADHTVRLWNAKNGSFVVTFTGHTDAVSHVSFSADSKALITSSVDRTARLWDVNTQKELRKFDHNKFGKKGSRVRTALLDPAGKILITTGSIGDMHAWDIATGELLRTVQERQDIIFFAAAISPTGKILATGGNDHAVRFWDFATFSYLPRLAGHLDQVRAAAISQNGQWMVTVGDDSSARLWDTTNGQQIGYLKAHTSTITAVAISPDDAWIATASADRTVRLWDAHTRQVLRTFTRHTDIVTAVAFSADGQKLATASADKSILVWNVMNGQLLALIWGHTNSVNTVMFSDDGNWLLSGSTDQTARLWSVNSGLEVRHFEGHTGSITSVAFSPDNSTVLTASVDKSVRLWNTNNGAEIHRFMGHTGAVTAAGFSPDGQMIVTASADWTARVWEIASGSERLRLDGHKAEVWFAAFSADGKTIVTTSADRTARLWNASSILANPVLQGHAGDVNSAMFSSDGKTIVTASDDKTARIWDSVTGAEKQKHSYPDTLHQAAFSPDGKLVVVACADRIVYLWNVVTNQEIGQLKGHTAGVNTASFSPDGKLIVSGGYDHTARLWDVATGQEIRRLEGHTDIVNSAAFSPDGKLIATGSVDNTIRLWNTATGQMIHTLNGHKNNVNSVSFSPDGKSLASASEDLTARLWDVATGQEITHFDHVTIVNRAIFSPDEKMLVTATDDGTIHMWDLKTGLNIRHLEGHSNEVTWVAFNPDGKLIVSASEDDTAHVWDVKIEDLLARTDQLIQRDPPRLSKVERLRFGIDN